LNGSHADHRFAVLSAALAIFREAAALVEPAKSALHHPAAFLHDEAFDERIPLDDLQAQSLGAANAS
jgi:hypothetical protein